MALFIQQAQLYHYTENPNLQGNIAHKKHSIEHINVYDGKSNDRMLRYIMCKRISLLTTPRTRNASEEAASCTRRVSLYMSVLLDAMRNSAERNRANDKRNSSRRRANIHHTHDDDGVLGHTEDTNDTPDRQTAHRHCGARNWRPNGTRLEDGSVCLKSVSKR